MTTATGCPNDYSHHNITCTCPPEGADYHDCGDLDCRGECENPTDADWSAAGQRPDTDTDNEGDTP